MEPSCGRPDWPSSRASGGRRAAPRKAVRGLVRGPRRTPLAALLAVALDLPRELLLALVDRVHHVVGGGAGAQRDALQIQRRLGDLAVGDGGIALLAELQLELRELGDLTGDLSEALLDVVPKAVADVGVPSLDRDAHGAPPLRRVG